MTSHQQSTSLAPAYTGADLKQSRTALKLTQSELAAYLSVHRETVLRWEAGTLRMERPGLIALAMEGLSQRLAPDHA